MKLKIIFLIFIVAVSCDDIAYGFDCHGPDCTPRQANHSASYAEGRWSADGKSWTGAKGTGGVASSQTPPAAREGKESLLGRLSQAVWQPISKMISVPKRLLWETENVCAVDERFRAVRDDTFDPMTVDSAAWIDTEGQINFAYKANTAISSVSFGDSCPYNYDARAENTAWTIVQGDSTEDQQVRYKKDYHRFVEDCGSFKREGDGCFSEIGSVVQTYQLEFKSPYTIADEHICIKDTVTNENQFLVSTCTSGDGNVMLEEYWRNDAKCIVVNREPAAGVMRLTIVCQILYPYTAEAKGTKIIGNVGASTAFDLHQATAIGANKWTKVHTMVIYEPQEDCGMGNDMLLTYNVECIEGSVCEETKEEMTIVIKDDFAKCPKVEKAQVPLAGKVQLYRSQDNGEKEKTFHIQAGSWNNILKVFVESSICIVSFAIKQLSLCVVDKDSLMCEDGVEQFHFIDNGEFVKNEDGSDRIRNAKWTEGEKTDIWSAEVFPEQLKDLSQKPALLKVLLTEIAGGPCGRRLGQMNASHLPRRLESFDDQSSAIPVSFAKEQDAASCSSCEGEIKSVDEVKSVSDGGNLDGGIIALIIILSVLGVGGGGYTFYYFHAF